MSTCDHGTVEARAPAGPAPGPLAPQGRAAEAVATGLRPLRPAVLRELPDDSGDAAGDVARADVITVGSAPEA